MKLARKLLRNILVVIGFLLSVPGLALMGLGEKVYPSTFSGIVPFDRE